MRESDDGVLGDGADVRQEGFELGAFRALIDAYPLSALKATGYPEKTAAEVILGIEARKVLADRGAEIEVLGEFPCERTLFVGAYLEGLRVGNFAKLEAQFERARAGGEPERSALRELAQQVFPGLPEGQLLVWEQGWLKEALAAFRYARMTFVQHEDAAWMRTTGDVLRFVSWTQSGD